VLSAVLTLGEGYHNFHHQFPTDYRNAVHTTVRPAPRLPTCAYADARQGFDPTKWFIWLCGAAGLASHLRRFPANEIAKGALTMRLKALKRTQDALAWPPASDALPMLSWAECARTLAWNVVSS
jgi:stearoyl-CoA desaturase (delta-9 desaturase)